MKCEMPKRNVKKQEKRREEKRRQAMQTGIYEHIILITVFIYLCMLNTRVYTSKCKSMEAYGRSSQ